MFQGKLEDQGRLLMQGAFNVWADNKSLRGLRFKPMQRHVFLYENIVLFCKKKDDPGHASHTERASYIFKNSIQVSKFYIYINVPGLTVRRLTYFFLVSLTVDGVTIQASHSIRLKD